MEGCNPAFRRRIFSCTDVGIFLIAFCPLGLSSGLPGPSISVSSQANPYWSSGCKFSA